MRVKALLAAGMITVVIGCAGSNVKTPPVFIPDMFSGYRAQDMEVPIPRDFKRPLPEPKWQNPAIIENICIMRRIEQTSITVRVMHLESLGRYFLTAYCNCGRCCTYPNSACADGTYPEEFPSGQYTDYTACAIDRSLWRFGSLFYIPSMDKIVEAHDTGSAVKGHHIDIYFNDHGDVASYGSHTEEIYSVAFEEYQIVSGDYHVWDDMRIEYIRNTTEGFERRFGALR